MDFSSRAHAAMYFTRPVVSSVNPGTNSWVAACDSVKQTGSGLENRQDAKVTLNYGYPFHAIKHAGQLSNPDFESEPNFG